MAKLKAVFHYAASAGIRKSLTAAENDWLTIQICEEGDDERLFKLIENADVLWHVLQPATAELISAAPKLNAACPDGCHTFFTHIPNLIFACPFLNLE